MTKIHILDPQLTGVGGHYFNHDSQLLREVQRRGLPVALHGRKQATIDRCGDVPIARTFSNDIFQEAGNDPLVWAMENFHAVNTAFLMDLGALDPNQFSASDLIYFPNLLQNQVYAISLWLGSLPPARRPATALMFRFLNHAMDYVQARANKDVIALYYRYAVRQLVGAHPRTLICADTAELTAAYREITGVPVHELPNPMDVSALLAAASASSPAGESPVVAYLGTTSFLRGFHLLPDIVDRCATLTPRPRFVIQLQDRQSAMSTGLGQAVARLDAARGEHLRLVEGALSQADYLALFAGADVIVLPYSPRFYGYGSSGVFTEAASVGKVVVISAGTAPARQAPAYDLAVVTADAWTPDAVANAVTAALADLPALRRRAQASAPRFRQENCAQAFWDKLFAAAQALPGPALSVAA